ncbi:MAG: efflux RND transporter periplasmic adaptor subunit [Treponema sp.]|nr:efflux RND transporter periplasmic adaptor subunit [Treponema sp.]
MKNKTFITVIIVVVLLAITAGTTLIILRSAKNKGGGMPAGGFGGRGGPQTATAVRTVVAKNQTITDFVYTNGEIETQKSIEVFPSIGGKVVEMKVSLGSPVKAGDVIAYVDPSEPGSYYAKSPVTAPIDGSIITSPVKIGQKVNVNSVITKIGDIGNLQITAKVPERYVAELAIGQKAEITLQAYGEEKFMASVVRISPVVDPSTRTKEIILNFDKNYAKVNAGMFARVKLFTVDYGGYPVIQQDAFVENSDEYYLYIVKEDSTVTKRKVTRGKSVDGYIQVLDGISAGEVVVLEGMLSLYEGAKVKDISGNVESVDVPKEGFAEGKK